MALLYFSISLDSQQLLKALDSLLCPWAEDAINAVLGHVAKFA